MHLDVYALGDLGIKPIYMMGFVARQMYIFCQLLSGGGNNAGRTARRYTLPNGGWGVFSGVHGPLIGPSMILIASYAGGQQEV